MLEVSPEIEQAILLRLECGVYGSADELLQAALNALDVQDENVPYLEEWMEEEILKSLDGPGTRLTMEQLSQRLDFLAAEALSEIEARRSA